MRLITTCMALAKRIIPTILVRGNMAVKGKNFSADRVIGNALQLCSVHASRGIDELCILDVACDEPNYRLIENITENLYSPLSVGGGIKTVECIRKLLLSGADKVVIKAYERDLICSASNKFGSQAVIACVNYHNHENMERQVLEAIHDGAGEILLQCVDRDGHMTGYDLVALELIAHECNIPVVISGGCRDYDDMLSAIRLGADGVAAGALFSFTDATPQEAARYLDQHGIEVRQ